MNIMLKCGDCSVVVGVGGSHINPNARHHKCTANDT